VDATHESFARAFERWEQYDPPPVAGVVARHCQPRRARHVASPARSVARRPAIGHAFERWPAARTRWAIRRSARRSAIWSRGALDGLKSDARAALVLRHYYGYDYAEIAGFLRTSPGNVGSILSRAHDVLRKRLAIDDGEHSSDGVPERRAAP